MRALPDSLRQSWFAAVFTEYGNLERLETFDPLRHLPDGKKALRTKHVNRVKYDKNGNVEKFKVRVCVEGQLMEHGTDYQDTHAPTTDLLSMRLLLVTAEILGLRVFQVDVVAAFLHSTLTDEIYIQFPEGMTFRGCKFARLRKSLYGLKQAAHDWHQASNAALLSLGFTPCANQPCMYYLAGPPHQLLALSHVDDYLVAATTEGYAWFSEKFGAIFETNDLGPTEHYLQIAIARTEGGYVLSQERMINDMICEMNMQEEPPREYPLIASKAKALSIDAGIDYSIPFPKRQGQLLWLQRCSRPDISQAVAYMSRFSHSFSQEHSSVQAGIVAYLKGTMSLGLRLTPHLGLVKVTAYSDSDWGGCPYTMKSTTGFVIYVNGAPVDWGSQRQKLVAQSTAEAEIIALNETVRRVAYVRNILLEFVEIETPSKVHTDNEACRLISNTSTCSGRTRHIDMRLMCVREMVANGVVEILRVPTNLNPADGHTKALTGQPFRQFRNMALRG